MILFPLVLVFYEIALYLSVDMYMPALPSMRQDLHTSAYLAQLTVTLWFLGSAALQLVLGPVSDYLGRRPVILTFCIVFIISSITCAVTNNIYVMIVARFFQGTAVCSVGVAGYATIHELLEHKSAITVLAWMGSITIMAPTLGPLLGSIVLEFGSWRDIFWIIAIASLLALLLLWFIMPESNKQTRTNALHFPTILKTYYTILNNKKFVGYAVVVCCLFSGMIAWISTGAVLIIEQLHYSPLVVGVLQIFVFGSFVTGTLIVRFMVRKYPSQLIARVGVTIALLGGAMALILAVYWSELLIALVMALMLYALGSAMLWAPLNRLAMEAIPNIAMGTKMAMFSAMVSTSGVFGSIIARSNIMTLAIILATTSVIANVLYRRIN